MQQPLRTLCIRGLFLTLSIFRRCYFLDPMRLSRGGPLVTGTPRRAWNPPTLPDPNPVGRKGEGGTCSASPRGARTMGEVTLSNSPHLRAGLRSAQPAGQGPLLGCCKANVLPSKRLVIPFPLPKQSPVKLGRFGTGLRLLSSCTGLGQGHLGGIQEAAAPRRGSPPSFP